MASLIGTLLSTLFPVKHRSRVYVDAATFDPHSVQSNGKAVLIVACNEATTITEQVLRERQRSTGVVVLDQGSTDATPHLAAEAGAIVVLRSPAQSEEEALQQALQVAHKVSKNVELR
jgi:glutamate racemase